MSPDELIEAGRTLFGDRHWKSMMADMLKINRRSVQRMSKGEEPVPPGVAKEIELMIRERIARLENIEKKIQVALAYGR